MIRYCVLIAVSLCMGCSMTGSDSEVFEQRNTSARRFEVSVTQDGQPVSDFTSQLVHRVAVSPEELRAALGSGPNGTIVPFELYAEDDSWGKPYGVKVGRPRGPASLSTLGLREGDLVTAVGTVHVKEARDLLRVFRELHTRKRATLTLERSGSPHKMIYYIKKPKDMS